ncbi:hypothetical protein M409DRAFT_65269 [Zasmidium cellare ATCC 36951]|uniref:N-acetyltransferase domain-containing protein n=1 Tax=Zasmidium cellare ATCC 36951 TaxID=1080233 RepID=A0A6A6CSW6_ZASCE|nr:uncharacterized protein M409DRAFT_65269 [Zasmidium cellare ATCC 36951]KAF2168922.1 hypothetical protein M409DRAFT_65269 [Zasmidium cellare ATCC 36951]
MKVNEHTALSTPTVLLVPYSESHVTTYHEWMKDESIQEATASEPLSLEEEYAMQRSWRNDRDKLTFIVCLPLSNSPNDTSDSVRPGEFDNEDRMIGDINLFLFDPDSEEMEQDVEAITPGVKGVVGEIELMIARKDFQQKGYGRAAVLTFIDYILTHWNLIAAEYARDSVPPQLSFLRVKVQKGNAGSIRLFESLGFIRTVEEANYFGEVELRWLPDLGSLRKGKGWDGSVEIKYGS